MKKIYHPKIKDITVEAILRALCDPVRVQIFMEIAAAECPQNCSNFLQVKNKKLPKSTLSNHFKILREAGLIKSEKKGLELHNTSRCKELKDKFGPLIITIIDNYRSENEEKSVKKKTKK
jgi:DNA-binding transcriptional ArsR family regulator